MILQIIQRMGYLMSTLLFGVLAYLTAFDSGKKSVYDSPDDYMRHYNSLTSDQKFNILQMIRYDNVLVFFFGLFLSSYAYSVGVYHRKWRLTIVITALLYMICDWSENGIMTQAIGDENFESRSFYLVQILKYFFAASAFLTCILLDIFIEGRVRKVFLYGAISVGVIAIFRFLIPMF